jgi:hypothetical protein
MAICGRCLAAREVWNEAAENECKSVNQIKVHYARHNRAQAAVASVEEKSPKGD